MVLRITLVADTILALLRLGRHDDAHFWGMRSINLMRAHLGANSDEPHPHFPAARVWGQVYFRTALAAKGMGRAEDAAALFAIAAAWLPGDRAAQAEWLSSSAGRDSNIGNAGHNGGGGSGSDSGDSGADG